MLEHRPARRVRPELPIYKFAGTLALLSVLFPPWVLPGNAYIRTQRLGYGTLLNLRKHQLLLASNHASCGRTWFHGPISALVGALMRSGIRGMLSR